MGWQNMVYRIINGRILGKPNTELVPEDAARLGAIIGTWYGKKSLVVTGRDYSPASRMIKRSFISGLMSVGVEVMDFHESVAGEISYAIKKFGARGGLNVANYPALEEHVQLRIYSTPGRELVGEELEEIIKRENIRRVKPHETGWVTYAEYIHSLYSTAILSYIDSHIITSKQLSIVISVSYGPSDKVLPDILSNLGVDYVLINTVKPPIYSQLVYPSFSEIKRVSKIVQAMNSDLGVILSNDASSAIFIDNEGRMLLPEEIIVALSRRLAKNSLVLYSDEIFGFIDKYLQINNISFIRTKVGHGSIIKATNEHRPVLSFNGLGEYIHPGFSLGYDAILTLVKLLESVAYLEKDLSSITKNLAVPKYYVVESTGEPEEVFEKLCSMADHCITFIGGYRVRINNQNIVITKDPIMDSIQIKIDAHAPLLDKIIKKIHKILSSIE